MSLRSQPAATDAYAFSADPVLRSPVRVMRVWSKDRARSVLMVNTKATHDAAYGGQLAVETVGAIVREIALSEAAALRWIANERAIAQRQAEDMKAERLASIRAQRPAVQTARAA